MCIRDSTHTHIVKNIAFLKKNANCLLNLQNIVYNNRCNNNDDDNNSNNNNKYNNNNSSHNNKIRS